MLAFFHPYHPSISSFLLHLVLSGLLTRDTPLIPAETSPASAVLSIRRRDGSMTTSLTLGLHVCISLLKQRLKHLSSSITHRETY
ncbi:hypothetical protein BDR05DRAFT_417515 [Suillus weaverae]|nr:hypothetical protein BDR05DRAFT_417515 [Suillus weaverae]